MNCSKMVVDASRLEAICYTMGYSEVHSSLKYSAVPQARRLMFSF